MDSSEDFQRTREIAEAALAAMLRHQVPPSPRNYRLWFLHLGGGNPELSRTIEILISNGQEFTAERNDELCRRFLEAEDELAAIQQTGERLQKAVSQVMSYVDAASGAARDYGRRLGDYSVRLSQEGDETSEALPAIVADLLAETQRVAARNDQLESRLSQSSGEIRELRQNLAAVRREALTDALTGIGNRKSFEQRLREAAQAAMENGEPLALLLIDIDHFKKFNDTYGHQLGDQVLRLVARTLTECVKGRDFTARYGGEEFAIILPQTRLEGGVIVADQVRRTMMQRKVVNRATGEDYGTITLSIGVSAYVPGEPLVETVRRADAALYQAKRAGRNRVLGEDAIPASAPAA